MEEYAFWTVAFLGALVGIPLWLGFVSYNMAKGRMAAEAEYYQPLENDHGES